jgi:hypothetical protein
VHICILRTLAWHDSTKLRAKRKLDFEHLDHTTWKDFLWEFLRYAQQPAWWRSHVIHRAPEKPLVDLHTGDVRLAPPSCVAAADSKDHVTINGASVAVKQETKPGTNFGQIGGQKSSTSSGLFPSLLPCSTVQECDVPCENLPVQAHRKIFTASLPSVAFLAHKVASFHCQVTVVAGVDWLRIWCHHLKGLGLGKVVVSTSGEIGSLPAE